jgi:hypothetical protein
LCWHKGPGGFPFDAWPHTMRLRPRGAYGWKLEAPDGSRTRYRGCKAATCCSSAVVWARSAYRSNSSSTERVVLRMVVTLSNGATPGTLSFPWSSNRAAIAASGTTAAPFVG